MDITMNLSVLKRMGNEKTICAGNGVTPKLCGLWKNMITYNNKVDLVFMWRLTKKEYFDVDCVCENDKKFVLIDHHGDSYCYYCGCPGCIYEKQHVIKKEETK